MEERFQTIHQQALSAAQAYRRAEAALVHALIDVERERVFARLGFSSLFLYAVQALGLSEACAYSAITVARKSRQVPALMAALDEGEITVSKAQKIASVITPENQVEWLEKAKRLPSRAIEKEVARENPKTATPERARYVDGERLALSLGVNEALMLKLRRAQDQVSRSRGRPVSLEETLAELTEFFLARKDPVEKAKRVVAKRGLGIANSSREELRVRKPLPAALAHRIRLRDGGVCQHRRPDGVRCGERRWVDLHHVIPLSEGGPDTEDNLVTLCRTHHRLEHEASDPGCVGRESQGFGAGDRER